MWFYAISGQQFGPISEEELIQLRKKGTIGPQTLVWKQGTKEWIPFFQTELMAQVSTDVDLTWWRNLESPKRLNSLWRRYFICLLGYFILGNILSVLGIIHLFLPLYNAVMPPESEPKTFADFQKLSQEEWNQEIKILQNQMISAPEKVFQNPEIRTNLLWMGGGMLVVFGLMILWIVSGLQLLYALWKFIPPGTTPVTPGKAVGFLLIPFFNLYWVFVAVFQLSQQLGKIAYLFQIPHRNIEKYAWAMCVAFLFLAISTLFSLPMTIHLLISLATTILPPVVLFKMKNLANDILKQ